MSDFDWVNGFPQADIITSNYNYITHNAARCPPPCRQNLTLTARLILMPILPSIVTCCLGYCPHYITDTVYVPVGRNMLQLKG
jgi:hypothetical protein